MHAILLDLNDTIDVEASAIISKDGLVMASLLPHGMNEDNVGAMSAAMLSVASHGSREFVGGELEQMLIKGENGYIVINRAGSEAVLTVMTKLDAKLDNIFLDLSRSAEKISAMM